MIHLSQIYDTCNNESHHNARCTKCLRFLRWLEKGLVCFCLVLLMCYRYVLSPAISAVFGARCRYYPSCSEYAMICFRKYSLWHALKKTAHRVLRCHPFSDGGVDIP